ncbi:MAG: HAD-IIIC family phosphatase, partial [Cyclobacteriaceae bacterium]
MNIGILLRSINEAGVRLFIEAGELKVKAPDGKLAEDLVEAIRTHKPELIELLNSKTYERIPVAKPAPRYPLSRLQMDYWLLSKMDHADSVHNITNAFTCKGRLDTNLLEKAFESVIAKHEILRTVFLEDQDGTPFQKILEKTQPFRVKTYHIADQVNPSDSIDEIIISEQNTVFDLSAFPLYRVTVIVLSDNESVICCTFSHLVADGWSMPLIMQEVLAGYGNQNGADNNGKSSIQYKDYTAWSESRLDSNEIRTQKDYWQTTFTGEIPCLNMSVRKPRPALKTYNGNAETITLSKEITENIHRVSSEHDTTLFNTLLAVINVLLYKYTGDTDTIVGTMVAGREHADLEHTIGMFANTLALRTTFNGKMSFQEMISLQKKITLQAFENQQVPFQEVVNSLNLKRDEAKSPLFDVMVILQNQNVFIEEKQQKTLPFELKPYSIPVNKSQVDIKFEFIQYGETIDLRIGYNTDIYEKWFISQLGGHLKSLLEGINSQASFGIDQIDLMTDADRKEIRSFGERAICMNPSLNKLVKSPEESTIMILSEQLRLVPKGVLGKVYLQIDHKNTVGNFEYIPSPFAEDKNLLLTGFEGKWHQNGILQLADTWEKQPDRESEKIKILASFTADHLKPGLQWFFEEFHLNYDVQLGNYHQVFQELLTQNDQPDQSGTMTYLILNRFEDYIKGLRHDEMSSALKKACSELIETLERQAGVGKIVVVFLPVDKNRYGKDICEEVLDLQVQTIQSLAKLPSVYTIDLSAIAESTTYAGMQVFDALTDDIAHIPYTEEFFNLIGLRVSRFFLNQTNSPIKVIALDCDNTLWQGVCGECETEDLKITGGYKALQQFVIEKYHQGFLIVLLSKNNETDVWRVFDSHPDMLLKRAHILAHRINWEKKSKNLIALSEQLNVGADSFAFIDDNPMECELMTKECPEVLTLLLPPKEIHFKSLLENVVAFDKYKVSQEDTERSEMYRSDEERKAYGKKVSLEDFLKDLKLELSFQVAQSQQLERISQLTQRTNQFNLNGVKKTVPELLAFISHPDQDCYVIHLKDKFGNYGLVGAVGLKRTDESTIESTIVEHFMLSCRVLGRDVEHAILGILIEIGKRNSSKFIEMNYLDTGRNIPFHEFLFHNKWLKIRREDSYYYQLPLAEIITKPSYIRLFIDQSLPEKETTKKIDSEGENDSGTFTGRVNLQTTASQSSKSHEPWEWNGQLTGSENGFHKYTYKALSYSSMNFIQSISLNHGKNSSVT